MYIQPNSTIKLIKGCPLDSRYENTAFFETEDRQISYFDSLTYYLINYQTYQRSDNNKIRIAKSIDDVYDVNYMAFKNTNYENKWFYAFVTDITYVNNSTCEITYEVDVLQTWMFDYTLNECFVEREHSATDDIGDNVVDEGLETGEYIVTSENNQLIKGVYCVLLATDHLSSTPEGVTEPKQAFPVQAGLLPVPGWAYYFEINEGSTDLTEIQDLQRYIKGYSSEGKSESIVTIFTVPKEYNLLYTLPQDVGKDFTSTTHILPSPRTSIQVKNRKLYTFPFCFASLSTGALSQELKYEMFYDENLKRVSPKIKVLHDCGPSPEPTAIPINYLGESENFEYAVALKGFPVCAWINNSYLNWVAQKGRTLALSTANSVAANVGSNLLPVIGAVATGAMLVTPWTAPVAIGAVATGLAVSAPAIFDSVKQFKEAKLRPNYMGGSVDSETMFCNGKSGFYLRCKALTPQYTKIIDDYFTMFGYATKRVKVPNVNVRKSFTYTKTLGCTIDGNIPASHNKAICKIYDNGIRFWKNPNIIGLFSVDNAPLSEGSEGISFFTSNRRDYTFNLPNLTDYQMSVNENDTANGVVVASENTIIIPSDGVLYVPKVLYKPSRTVYQGFTSNNFDEAFYLSTALTEGYVYFNWEE